MKFRYKPKTYVPERERISDPNNHGLSPKSVERARANPKDFEVMVSLDFLQRVCADATALTGFIAHEAIGELIDQQEQDQFNLKTAQELEHRLRLYAYGYTEGKSDEIKSDIQFRCQLMDLIAKLLALFPKETTDASPYTLDQTNHQETS